jgi:RND family efflux transporter MFP subunit
MKGFLTIAIIIAIGVGVLYTQREKLPWIAQKEEAGPPPTAKVEKRDIELNVKASGDIKPMTEIEIRSEVSGMIKEVYVDLGDEVERGRRLLQIDDTNLLIERERTQNELEGQALVLEQAQRDFDRIQRLAEKDLVSQEEVDAQALKLAMAENDTKKIENDLALVEDRLGKTTILSPIDGTVLDVAVEEGQVVTGTDSNSGGTTLINLADLSKKLIYTQVNQVDIAGINEGDPVIFTVHSLPDREIAGEVSNVAPVATTANGVKGFQVRVMITEEVPELRPGMTAEVRFSVAEVKDALALPIQAVFLDEEDNSIVYLKSDSGPKQIEVGISNFDYTEVVSGLKEGDEALLEEPRANAANQS